MSLNCALNEVSLLPPRDIGKVQLGLAANLGESRRFVSVGLASRRALPAPAPTRRKTDPVFWP